MQVPIHSSRPTPISTQHLGGTGNPPKILDGSGAHLGSDKVHLTGGSAASGPKPATDPDAAAPKNEIKKTAGDDKGVSTGTLVGWGAALVGLSILSTYFNYVILKNATKNGVKQAYQDIGPLPVTNVNSNNS